VEHRKNYINFIVKQLDLSDVKELLLEEIVNINYGRHVSRSMKHWVNTLIRDSLIKLCEETGVLFTHVGNEYNSQRCSKCGWVQKSNRKGKLFKCKACGHCEDADFNATQNILIRDTLFKLPFGFRGHRYNLKGFYWRSDGFYDSLGQALAVPAGPANEQNLVSSLI
jgi:transposase